MVAHNIHKAVAPVQEGGVGLLMFGPLLENLDMSNSSKQGQVRIRAMVNDGSTRREDLYKVGVWLQSMQIKLFKW